MVIILTILIIIIILILKLNKRNESFMIYDNINKLDKVYNTGRIKINRRPNQNLRVDELCVVNKNDSSTNLNKQCTTSYGTQTNDRENQCPQDYPFCLSNYCSKKNIGNCLNNTKLGIIKEIPPARISTVCIGENCISEDHLKILKGEKPFSMSTGNDLSYLFTNSLLTYYPDTYMYLVNSKNNHLSAQQDGAFQWNRPWTGQWESFILNPSTLKSTLQDYWRNYISQDKNGDVKKTPSATAGSTFDIITHDDGRISFKGAYGGYLSWKDEDSVKWNATEITDTEKFKFASVGKKKDDKKTGMAAASEWSINKTAKGSEIEEPIMNIWTSQEQLNDSAQLYYFSDIKPLPSPKVPKPEIGSIKYNTSADINKLSMLETEYKISKSTPNLSINENKLNIV
jgi:hypothetical protein